MAKRDLPSTHVEAVALLRDVARGEAAAIRTLYQSHADGVLAFVLRRVNGSYEDAQEITQDTFLSALSLARNFDGSCSPLTWLCGIAKLRIIDVYRRARRAKRIPPDSLISLEEESLQLTWDADSEIALERIVERLDGLQLLRDILDSLPDHEREVLILRYQDELPLCEIGVLMNRSEKAIERLLARARRDAAAQGAAVLQRQLEGSLRRGSGTATPGDRDGQVG